MLSVHRRVRVTAASGEKLSYAHNGPLPLKEALSGEVAHEYDEDFRPVEETVNGQDHVAYSHDGDGLVTRAGSLGLAWDPERGLVAHTELGTTTDARSYDAFGETEDYEALSGTDSMLEASYERHSLGRIARKTVGGKTATYSYASLGNLFSAGLPNGGEVEYLVDGNNRRVGKKVDGVLKQGFLYSGRLSPAAELDGSERVVSRFVYATRGNVPDYMTRGEKTYRVVSDHLGSPRLVVDAETGEVAQRMDYDEFGNVTRDTNPGFQPFGFAGGLYDADTKLVRFGARDYDAETGRFTAKDPIDFSGGDANLYGYVSNDPVNFHDPSGLFLDTIADVGFVGYNVYRIARDNVFGSCDNLGTNLGALAADAAFAAVPFATGGGAAVRAGAHPADDAAAAAAKGPSFMVTPGGTACPVPTGVTGPKLR